MRKALQTYKEYKDSGLTWLGSTPSDWSIVRNKEIFKERGSVSNTGKETLLTVSHITGVTPRSEKNVNMFMAETMAGYKICHEGDLIINTMWAWMGALGTSNELGICSPSYNVYMAQKGIPYNRRYFDYLFRIPSAVMEMTRNSKGIVSSRLRLYAKDFFQIETVLPSLQEQEAIATYLDTKTAQIDRKIDLLTQKSQRYEELKRSLINETVTRGLDKSVPMKDSGIDWLGEIPEHWEISRIKNLGILSRGVDLARDDFEEGTFPVYGSNGIIGYHSRYTTKAPCLTVGRSGSVGEVNYVSQDFWAHNTTLYLQEYFNNNVKFIFYLFKSLNLQSVSAGSAVGTLNRNIIHQLKIAIPPAAAQKLIAEYLDTKIDQIDQIIQTIDLQSEKQKELRKTLINDVVTGKIKVA